MDAFLRFINEARNFIAVFGVIVFFMLLSKMERRTHFPLRLVGSFFFGIAYGGIYLLIYEFLIKGSSQNWLYSIVVAFYYVSVAALSLLLGLFCFRCDWTKGLWILLTSYALSHIAFVGVLEFLPLEKNPAVLPVYFLFLAILCVGAFFLFGKKLASGGLNYLEDTVRGRLLYGLFFLLFIATTFVNQASSYNQNYAGVIADVLNCLLLLFLQYNSLRSLQLFVEKKTASYLLKKQTEQYRSYVDAVSYVNHKAHDLKYELRRLSGEETNEALRGIEMYESFANTGNTTLDSILTEYRLKALSHSISFAFMADATAIAGMQDSDILRIFGNLLDNAFSYVDTLDGEERFMRLYLSKQGAGGYLRIENPLKEELHMRADGLPKTSKKDATYHGFGLSSVKAIVQQYGGEMKVSGTDGLFQVEILWAIAS